MARQDSTVTPLPRGRHKLSRDAVHASQRERLVRAMLEVVARDGYAATTVQNVAAAARVSPNTFYRFFEDKLDCFLAAIDEDATQLLDELFAAGAAVESWIGAVRAGVRVYLEWWPARPEAGRTFLLELPAAGGRAVERRIEILERFVVLFEASAVRARADDPALLPISQAALRVLVHGLTDLVAGEVRAGRLEQLPALEDELVDLIVRVLA